MENGKEKVTGKMEKENCLIRKNSILHGFRVSSSSFQIRKMRQKVTNTKGKNKTTTKQRHVSRLKRRKENNNDATNYKINQH